MRTVKGRCKQMGKPGVRTKVNPIPVQHRQKENRRKPSVFAGFWQGQKDLSRLPPRSVLGAPHRGAAPEAAAETKSFCPCHKTGENTGFSPVFFLHVLYGNGVHFGSDTWFSHPFAPVPNRCHPLKHPKRTRLQLFSPKIGCVSLFLPSFDLQKFRAGFSQTSGLSSHSYRFILTRPFPDAMIRIPAFLS